MIKKMIAIDWLAMKVYQKWGLALIFMALLTGFMASYIVIPACVILFSLFSIFPFALEEKDVLNNLYLTLPIKRNAIVTGRYAFSFIMLICGILLGSAIMLIGHRFSLLTYLMDLQLGFNEYFTLLSASYLVYAILNIFMFPFLFKLGYNKGKIWGVFLPMFLTMVLTTIIMVIMISGVGKELLWKIITFVFENTLLTSIAMFVLATGILAVSYLISLKVYSKRDF